MYFKHLTLILLSLSIASLTLAQCPNTDIFLYTQADIDNFPTNYPGCTMIPSGVDVFIEDLNYNFTDLNGLSSITSIGGDLYIVGGVLPNLDGLSSLTSIGGSLNIEFSDELTNINGLSNLTTVGGGVFIHYNFSLTNLDGLSALTSVGGLIIQSNDVLTNVDGLSALTSIDGMLTIFENPILANLDGLSSVTSVGMEVLIEGNNMLTDIDGLSALTSVGGYLIVAFNPQLSMCCVLCPLLQADLTDDTVIGDVVGISDNAIGCDTADILVCPSCAVCVGTVDLDINFDGAPTQTSWELTDASGSIIASSGGNIYGPAFADANLPLNDVACLADGCYDLTFFDSANDGMCPRRTSTVLTGINIATLGLGGVFNGIPRVASSCGSYTLTDANGTILAFGGGRFGTSETTNFCVSGGIAVPLWQEDDSYEKTLIEDANTLDLSPNPAKDNLTIYYNPTNDFDTNIQVIDITGKIIYEITSDNNQIHFDISDLIPGFYFVKLVSGEIVLSEKFVKQ